MCCTGIIVVMYILPIPVAYVDAPAGDEPFATDPALAGSSTYAVQLNVIVICGHVCDWPVADVSDIGGGGL